MEDGRRDDVGILSVFTFDEDSPAEPIVTKDVDSAHSVLTARWIKSRETGFGAKLQTNLG